MDVEQSKLKQAFDFAKDVVKDDVSTYAVAPVLFLGALGAFIKGVDPNIVNLGLWTASGLATKALVGTGWVSLKRMGEHIASMS